MQVRSPSCCFAKGACGPDTPFHGIGQLIEPHMAEVKKYELSVRNKNQRPQKSQQMLGSDNQTVALLEYAAHACSLHVSVGLWG